ncbi:MAG: cysteine--tRNA ligase [Pseudomonadales bacterium]|nr:cysteine--tRNA ligase [Pseudomonadales bacterium]
MKLYNTLSKKIEEFESIKPNKVGLYACGFTVYDFTHLGHLRKYTMDDILIRTLKYLKYDVNFVQNITDVGHLSSDADTGEDKLEKGAKKYGKSAWDIAAQFEKYFFRSMDLMGNLRPSVSARATDHIEEQIDMVKQLEKKGFTYVIENDGIYFDTSKFSDYGKMAKLNLNDQKEGFRIDAVKGKRNPADFVLWKFEREGENRAMTWESPWHKRGFPGWHIECSAMAIKYLGNQFDIHTGGIDHIPVHHTNEIAQAEAATGKTPFVKYWVHHNFLRVDGIKMSKSLNNFFTIDDLLERGFHPLALRLLFLTAHYQSEMNFTWENLAGAQKSYQKLIKTVLELKDLASSTTEVNSQNFNELQPKNTTKINESNKNNQTEQVNQEDYYRIKFFGYLTDNLNTPRAVALMWEMIKSDLDSQVKLRLLLEFDQIFNLGISKASKIQNEFSKNEFNKNTFTKNDLFLDDEQLSKEIKSVLLQREEARLSSDWKKADELRDVLLGKGFRVVDSIDGQKLERI